MGVLPFDSSSFSSEPKNSMESKHSDKQLSRLALLGLTKAESDRAQSQDLCLSFNSPYEFQRFLPVLQSSVEQSYILMSCD